EQKVGVQAYFALVGVNRQIAQRFGNVDIKQIVFVIGQSNPNCRGAQAAVVIAVEPLQVVPGASPVIRNIGLDVIEPAGGVRKAAVDLQGGAQALVTRQFALRITVAM